MATFTWKGTIDSNAINPNNWSPATVPGTGDSIVIPAASTVDLINPPAGTLNPVTNIIDVAGSADTLDFGTVVVSGSTLTSGNGAAFGDFVWNVTDSTIDSSVITLGDFAELNLTGATSSSMQITSSGAETEIRQTGSGDHLRINATGTVSTEANLLLLAPGGTTSLNIAQDGTAAGFYLSGGALVDMGGALTIAGDSNTGTRFANQGLVLVAGIGAAASATLDARLGAIAGEFDIMGGSSGALLDDNTNFTGAQIVNFADAAGVLKIEATHTLSSAFNVGTVSTNVLQNFFARVTGFKPGSTIELTGVPASGLAWSFGNDPSYGNDVLTVSDGGATLGRIRFAGEQFVDGSGTFSAANTTNFEFTDDGSGDTLITLGHTVEVTNTAIPGGTLQVTGTVAQWNGVTNGATTDWSSANWTGGVGSGGIPGQFQTAQIALTAAQASAAVAGGVPDYVLTIATAETAGAVVMDDPFATLAISAPLTLSRIPGQTDGSGFVTGAGAVDIKSGGTVVTLRLLTYGDLSIEAGGQLIIGGNVPLTFGSGLAGLDVEEDARVTGGSVGSFGNITVGSAGNGTMTAEAGAVVNATYTQVGGNAALLGANNPQSTLDITGASHWFDTNADASTPLAGGMVVGGGAPSLNGLGQIVINAGGDGLVQISDGAVAVEAAFAIVGAARGSQGEVDVSNGGTWLVGTGTTATPGSIVFGNTITGTATLFGASLPQLVVGSGGPGTLNINSGTVALGGAGAFDADRMFIGTGNAGNNTATGFVSVSGAGALLNANGPVSVSFRSNATLDVSNGGTVMVAADPTVAHIQDGMDIGNTSGTVGATAGTVDVNSGGFLSDAGDLVIGHNSQGFLNVGAGGSVNVTGALIMGGVIGLNNGTVAIPATLFKGSGSGTLNAFGNGVMTVAGDLDMFQGGTTTPTASTISLGGSAELIVGGGSGAAGELTVAAGATLQGAGEVLVSTADSVLRNAGTVLAGGLTSNGTPVQNGATLELHAVLAGSGVFALAPGATMLLDNPFVDTSNFDFGTGNIGSPTPHNERLRVVDPPQFQGTISNFYGGTINGIDFLGASFQSQPTYTPNADPAAGGTVSVVTGAGTISFSVVGAHSLGFSAATDGAGTGTFVFANNATPCFAAGTRVLTAQGEVPVEALRAGALVPARSGAMRRVRWIGRTRVAVDAGTAPVAVRAGAFGAGAPHRALVLSPDHAVWAGGALVPVQYLANGGSVARTGARGVVEYFHVELDGHDVLFADGLAAESYLDTGNRAQFAETVGVEEEEYSTARSLRSLEAVRQ